MKIERKKKQEKRERGRRSRLQTEKEKGIEIRKMVMKISVTRSISSGVPAPASIHQPFLTSAL